MNAIIHLIISLTAGLWSPDLLVGCQLTARSALILLLGYATLHYVPPSPLLAPPARL